MSVKVILADDHQMFREGLRSLMERQIDIELIAEAEDGRSIIKLLQKLSPDVIIMDVSMPGLNGIEATRQIKATYADVKVIALSMHSNRRYVIGMLKAGASGYLLKDCAVSELCEAIRIVAAGQVYLNPRINTLVVNDYLQYLSDNTVAEFADSSVLSAREREVLQLLAEGKRTKEIASILHVSIKTVERHRQNIMGKLNINSIAELTKYAIQEGLTSVEF